MLAFQLKTSRLGLGLIGLSTLLIFNNCARMHANVGSTTQSSVVFKSELMSHDMILDRTTGYRPLAASGFSVYQSTPWTNGILPIEFRDSVPAARRALFLRQCTDWSASGRVRCVAHTTETNYVYVTNDPGTCYSYVGMGAGGARPLNIADVCDDRAVLHEIGHALGLMHEHQRPDRDQFITVHVENAAPEQASNFTLLSATEHASGYDFSSIMHYEAFAFSNNGQPTIVANPGYGQFQNGMGRAASLSPNDRAVIDQMYQPSQINGYLDSATGGNGKVVVNGWACSTGLAQSIPVHLYAGGAAGVGTFVTSAMADQPSEAGVNAACSDTSGLPHRFSIVMDASVVTPFIGQPLFVHGISPVGAANLTIEKSGTLSMPSPGGNGTQPSAVLSVATHPIHRYYNPGDGAHLMSAIANEAGAPWVYEGAAFRLLDQGGANRQALYRCLVPGSDDHFMSLDANCEGQAVEGLLGYSQNTQVAGSSPLYRCYRGGAGHLMTTSAVECMNAGFTIEFNSGPIGFVF